MIEHEDDKKCVKYICMYFLFYFEFIASKRMDKTVFGNCSILHFRYNLNFFVQHLMLFLLYFIWTAAAVYVPFKVFFYPKMDYCILVQFVENKIVFLSR